MRCPKCGWVGFERLPRCRHCGYDLAMARRPVSGEAATSPVHDEYDDPGLSSTGARHRPSTDPLDGPLPSTVADWLPLFDQPDTEQAPVRRVPPPRAPLSVRRTSSELPRLKTRPVTARQSRQVEAVPSLRQTRRVQEPIVESATRPRTERPVLRSELDPDADAFRPTDDPIPERFGGAASEPAAEDDRVPASARALSMATDGLVLGAVALVVCGLTFGIAGLSLSDWRSVPVVPLVAFLVLFALAYHAGFTASGGQTLGKMLTGLQVESDGDSGVAPGRAIGRAVLALCGGLLMGVGLLPALVGHDRRALHDRLTGTRVVRVR